MGEELPKTIAQVVESRLVVLRDGEPVFGASSIADVKPRTCVTLPGQVISLGITEHALYRRVDQLGQGRGRNIPDPVLRRDEVIARIDGTVLFYDEHAPAGRGHPAKVCASSRPYEPHLGNLLDFKAPDVVPGPFVENGAEEIPVALRGD